ncbi:MAG: C-terminal processing protease CtpA/Prc [Phenylobacterium sp.]
MKKLIIVISILLSLPALGGDITAPKKSSLLTSLQDTITNQYVLTEKIGAIKSSLQDIAHQSQFKTLADKTEVAQLLSKALKKHDKHFAVQWRDPSKAPEKQAVKEGWFSKLKRKNSGFNKIEILEGNVGYIDFWGFDDLNGDSRKKVEQVMGFVADVDALIFDLRKNGGGSAQMVQLLSSYFFANKTHLNGFYARKTGQTSQFWTFDDIEGERRPKLPLYILTSAKTFSAAEEFAYNLKHLKRATIIGESTKGGANPWAYVELGDGFRAAIPISKAVNPVTNTNWEGVGVQPHINTNSAEAFDTAYRLALEALKLSVTAKHQKAEIEAKLEALADN